MVLSLLLRPAIKRRDEEKDDHETQVILQASRGMGEDGRSRDAIEKDEKGEGEDKEGEERRGTRRKERRGELAHTKEL